MTEPATRSRRRLVIALLVVAIAVVLVAPQAGSGRASDRNWIIDNVDATENCTTTQ